MDGSERGGQGLPVPENRTAASEPAGPNHLWVRSFVSQIVEILTAPTAVSTAESASTNGFREFRVVPRLGMARALDPIRIRSDTTMETLLIIVVLLFLFGGGGYYWRSRRG